MWRTQFAPAGGNNPDRAVVYIMKQISPAPTLSDGWLNPLQVPFSALSLSRTPAPLDDFERVVLPYMDDAYTLARYLMRDEHDAQDIVQEAYLRALRHYDPVHHRATPRAWLLTIVRHCCFHVEEQTPRRCATVEYDDAPSCPGRPGAQSRGAHHRPLDARRHSRRARCAALRTFREVIILREIQELAYREIAQVIGIPIGTVMSRLARARRRLQDALGGSSQAAG